ncbi:integral membrane sensor signal transduction histidine kinase [gut metagenome]|uniref:histidine kinase n=1 Tax=gut metagenome TaxID=749906 RepID=J9GJC0_9ZZZZ
MISGKKRTGTIKEYGLRYCFAEFPGGRRLVFADVSGNMEILSNLMCNCLILGVAGFAALLCVSIWLSHWAVHPVDEAMKQQRQFIADASHELKTPLTVIITNAQLLQDPDCSESIRRQCEQGIIVMAERMRSMTGQLLQLARLDATQLEKNREKLDLSSLLEDEILPYEPCFFEKGLTFHTSIQSELWVNGDPEQLRQLLGILLDNARKYTIPGGGIWLLFKKKKRGRCVLSVANEGEPLSEEQCTKVFSRFYRTDGARSGESFGLGLAIARSIVEHHGGKIWLESSGGYNTCFVEIPCL